MVHQGVAGNNGRRAKRAGEARAGRPCHSLLIVASVSERLLADLSARFSFKVVRTFYGLYRLSAIWLSLMVTSGRAAGGQPTRLPTLQPASGQPAASRHRQRGGQAAGGQPTRGGSPPLTTICLPDLCYQPFRRVLSAAPSVAISDPACSTLSASTSTTPSTLRSIAVRLLPCICVVIGTSLPAAQILGLRPVWPPTPICACA